MNEFNQTLVGERERDTARGEASSPSNNDPRELEGLESTYGANTSIRSTFTIALGAFILYYVLCHCYWIVANQSPGQGDAYAHYTYGRRIQGILGSSEGLHKKILNLYDFDPVYPFTHGLVMGLGFLVLPASIKSGLYCHLVFLAAAFVGLYLLVRRFSNKWGGLYALVCLGLQPGFLRFLHLLYLEIPQTGMIAVTYGLLVQSRGLTRTRWSLGFAFACAFAALTKVLTLFFLVPLVLFFAYDLFDPQTRSDIKKLGYKYVFQLLMVVGIILGIAGPWYIFFGHLSNIAKAGAYAIQSLQGDHYTFGESLADYLSFLQENVVGLPLLLCLCWSTIYSVLAARRRLTYEPLALLLLTLATCTISLLLLSSLKMEISRWCLPLAPFLAAACAAPFQTNQPLAVRRINAFVAFVACVVLIWNTSFVNGWLQRGDDEPLTIAGFSAGDARSLPTREAWSTRPIAVELARRFRERPQEIPGGMTVSLPYIVPKFQPQSLYTPLQELTSYPFGYGHWGNWDQCFLAEWLVWKKGGRRGSDYVYMFALNELLRPPGPEFMKNHTKFFQLPLPDRSDAILLRRTRSPDPSEIIESVEKLLKFRTIHTTRPPGYFERYQALLEDQTRILQAFPYQNYISQLWTPEVLKNEAYYSAFLPLWGNGRRFFTPPKGSWRRIQIQCYGPGADGVGPEVAVAVNAKETFRFVARPDRLELPIVTLPEPLTDADVLEIRFLNDAPSRNLYIGNIYFQK